MAASFFMNQGNAEGRSEGRYKGQKNNWVGLIVSLCFLCKTLSGKPRLSSSYMYL